MYHTIWFIEHIIEIEKMGERDESVYPFLFIHKQKPYGSSILLTEMMFGRD